MQQDKTDQPQELYETRSRVSGSRSSRSSASSAATKAKARAEAALIEAKYAAKEAQVMKEKARIEAEAAQRKAELEANLYVLKTEKTATAASAEAAVYEAAAAMENDPLNDLGQIPPQDTAQRTNEYVQAHYAPDPQQEAPVLQQPPVTSSNAQRAPSPPPPPLSSSSLSSNQVQWYPLPNRVTSLSKPFIKNEVMCDTQNKAQTHNPHTSSPRDYACEATPVTDITKYLVRREMVSSGLLKFDDCPENYWAWKTSFQEVTRELSLTAREELDLLIKWLGPESSPQALRLGSANVHNATAGVAMVWQRLDETYGSPEIIEHALLSKLENFPKISNKDNKRLRELGDILMEIQSAKSGGHLPGLACLDTARGLNPIVEKLPYGLQERWITHGSWSKHLDERKTYLKENSICFRCCASTKHLAKDCKLVVKCKECNSDRHISALHPGPAPWSTAAQATEQEHGGEPDSNTTEVTFKCTEICDKTQGLRSCSKISLVNVYPANCPDRAHKMYVVLDDQSNRSLAKSDFFELFDVNVVPSTYTLKTCAGTSEATGRKAHNFVVASLDGQTQVTLPPLLECNTMPDDRSEIPTPDIVQHFPHLAPIAGKIPPLEPDTPILLLLGRDVLSVHKVREQYNGPHNTPLPKPQAIAYSEVETPLKQTDCLGLNVFQITPEDNKPAMSIEDKMFLELMDKEVYMDNDNHWVAPLPFRNPRPLLPNNREQALKRLAVLKRTLDKKPDMKKQFVEFMDKIFENDQAEIAPELQPDEECWCLPMFGVCHPQGPDGVRAVFDSGAQFDGVSLNETLIGGPDLNNTLLGVLLRFRREKVAVTVDVEQMFYCFRVKESHRNYLRFLWFKDNDLNKEITEYRMKVPVFGNSPSPAIAIYGLRKAAELGQEEHGSSAKEFVFRNFYVDDGLTSVSSESEAIELLTSARNMLAESNIRLHKIASNASQVMNAFPQEERATDLKDLDLDVDPLPLQRSLGVSWNLENDSFTFRVGKDIKPFTRRGILSVVNSLYDPLGFAAPVTIQGKALYRELTLEQQDWDEPLPAHRETEWTKWTD
ncbi:hypothetical protein WMY93_018646 [Mugilogobius chulae]|uniref:Uncharacterized protein n=1 Tax=Mugilogobius chulae TaxID=88201 RepID=A0AAW0NUT5_9GOBI